MPFENTGLFMFICKCNGEIKSVDFEKLERYIKKLVDISNIYFINELCRDPAILRKSLKDQNIKTMVIAGCSLYKEAFIEVVESSGLNPLSLELIPFRELSLTIAKDYSAYATLKLSLVLYSIFEKVRHSDVDLLRNAKPRRIKTQSKVSRRSLFRALPQGFTRYEPVPIISRERCIGATVCRFCIDACPRRVLSNIGDDRLSLDHEHCSICGVCVAVCPTGAIQIPNSTDEQLDAQIRGILMNCRDEIPSKIIMFVDSNDYHYLLNSFLDRKLSLPLEVFPLELPTLGLISENILLSSIIYGAHGILIPIIRDENKLDYLHVLYRKVFIVKEIMKSAGLDQDRIIVAEVEPDNLDLLIEKINQIRSRVRAEKIEKLATKQFIGDRRVNFVSIIRTFISNNTPVSDIIDYGDPCPFGEVIIDREKCTMCELCYSKCPTRAFTIIKEVDMITLAFNYQKCVGCTLCSSICPENAISLKRYLSLSNLLNDSPRVLITQELVKCSRCGKPFITRGKLRKIEKIYEGMGAAGVDKLQSLRLCPECKRTKIVPAEYDKWLIYR